jgi:hypothetical protein
MSESTMFSPKVDTGKKKEQKEQIDKPFIKKIEAPEDFICKYTDGNVDCGKEIKKGGPAWLVLTELDINEHVGAYPNEKPIPSMMCEDCMDRKIVKDREEIEKRKN